MFPGIVQEKGSNPALARGERAHPSLLEEDLYFQVCFGKALLTLCHPCLG